MLQVHIRYLVVDIMKMYMYVVKRWEMHITTQILVRVVTAKTDVASFWAIVIPQL